MFSPGKFIFLLFLTLAFPLHEINAQTRRAPSKSPMERKEYFANGNVKSVTVTKVKTPRNIDLFNLYKETKVIRTEFDSLSGRRIMHTERTTKIGMGGKHCYEYSSLRIDYDENGKRKRYEKSKCDKHYFISKDYVNGKVTFVHIEKKRRKK
ncbi:hypothetical protein BH11BAC7_BH11BAC7_13500 [soil metagenome]